MKVLICVLYMSHSLRIFVFLNKGDEVDLML